MAKLKPHQEACERASGHCLHEVEMHQRTWRECCACAFRPDAPDAPEPVQVTMWGEVEHAVTN